MNDQKSQKYDPEDRTLSFASDVRKVLRMVTRDLFIESDMKQLIRSSGSVGANYRKANEGIRKKDFINRIKRILVLDSASFIAHITSAYCEITAAIATRSKGINAHI